MSVYSSVSLETRILDLPICGIVGLGAMTARKLAAAVAEISTDTVDEIPRESGCRANGAKMTAYE